jgi:hypothetical protein
LLIALIFLMLSAEVFVKSLVSVSMKAEKRSHIFISGEINKSLVIIITIIIGKVANINFLPVFNKYL